MLAKLDSVTSLRVGSNRKALYIRQSNVMHLLPALSPLRSLSESRSIREKH